METNKQWNYTFCLPHPAHHHITCTVDCN